MNRNNDQRSGSFEEDEEDEDDEDEMNESQPGESV